jgi:hypothetical protein
MKARLMPCQRSTYSVSPARTCIRPADSRDVAETLVLDERDTDTLNKLMNVFACEGDDTAWSTNRQLLLAGFYQARATDISRAPA